MLRLFARLHPALIAGLMALAVLPLAEQAGAQTRTPPAKPASTTPQTVPGMTLGQLESLVRTIENDAERKAFLEKLKALIAAQKATTKKAEPKGRSLIDELSRGVEMASERFVRTLDAIVNVPFLWHWAQRQFDNPKLRELWIEGFWKTLLILAAGLLAEWLARLLLRRPRRSVELREIGSMAERILFLAVRTVLDLLPMGAFAAVAYGALPLLEPTPDTATVALTIIFANVLARAIRATARMILTPKAPNLRVLEISNETAAYLFVWIRRLTNVIVYSYFVILAAQSFGLPAGAFGAAQRLVGLVVVIMLIILILQNRRVIRDWLRDEEGEAASAVAEGKMPVADESDPRRRGPVEALMVRLADVWHILAVLFVLATFIVWLLEIDGGFQYLFRGTVLTALIVLAARLLVAAVRRLLARIFRVEDDLRALNPKLEERANRYLPVLRSLAVGLVYIAALIAVGYAWGIDSFGWLRTDLGRRVLGSTATIVAIVVGSLIFWEIVSAAFERYLERLSAKKDDAERTARMRTLIPMMQKAILVTLIVVASLIVMSELGINIGPLLAGAGVLGLAIGFGAQTLVKDVITGVFNLIEDTIAVGDVVTVASHTGSVEDVSIRSVRLRDYSGVVHTIPFSSISSVENFTKEFSYYVFDVGIGYRENVDEVMGVLRELGEGMRNDPVFGHNILADLEIAGLQSFGDSAIVVRARFKTKPGTQWGIGREMNRRIKAAFDERGIEIPFPHMTVYFGEDKSGNAPAANLRLIQGAAGQPPAPGAGPSGKDDGGKDDGGKDDGGKDDGGKGGETPPVSRRKERQRRKDAMNPAVVDGDGE